MKKTIILLLAGFGLIVLIQDFLMKKNKAQHIAPRPYVVMLALDGFRWDYQEKAVTPTLDYISEQGVKALGLQPAFPSKTAPNLYTIATGLYPGNHGIVSNSFYAPDLKKYYSIKDNSKLAIGKFYSGEPIWVTAEAQHVKTGSYNWVGSAAKIRGYQPTYLKKNNRKLSYLQSADTVISWLKKPYNNRPKLITWQLDKIGHTFAPESNKTIKNIQKIDSIIGYFLKRVKTLNIKDSVNFIIVSAHGTSAIDTNNVVYLNKYIKQSWVNNTLGENPVILLNSKKNCTDSILNKLKNVNGINAWAKNDIADRYFFKQSIRVPEIIIVADSGWSVFEKPIQQTLNKGINGYDNTQTDMNGVFYAIGPDFKNSYVAGQLYNTDIYNLIAKILSIKSAPNDGKPERIFQVLKNE